VTIEHDAAVCDGGCGALITITLEGFEEWERIPMEHGAEAHLCPRCQYKRDRGWLGIGYVLECIRCGRNTVDNPEIKQWWGTREPGASACDDCHDPEHDTTVI
jgi:hypothetical protein